MSSVDTNTVERVRAAAPLQGRFVDYCDARLFVPNGHFDEERMLEGGKPEVHVLGIFSRFVREGDVVVDVGANIGTHTFALAAIIRERGHVYAVEADVDNVSAIRASILASGASNVLLVAAAASDKPGLIRMLASSGTNSVFSAKANGDQIKVASAVALDDLIEEDVSFIKLDIEGAELLALRGLDKTIARCRPVILSEFSPAYIVSALGSDRSDEFFSFFESRDYDCFYLDPFGTLVPVRDLAGLLATYREAYVRFSWNHVDVLFSPADFPMAERPGGSMRSKRNRPAVPTQAPASEGPVLVFPVPLASSSEASALATQASAAPVSRALVADVSAADRRLPTIDEAALLERLTPLVLERLKATRPWRDNVYVPAPDVAYIPETSPFLPFSTCSVRDFLHPEFARINALLQQPLVMHRKIWEHVYIVHHIKRAELLKSGVRGLGFGVGKEMLPALFAGMGVDVVATDAPKEIGIGAGWQNSNEYAPGIDDLPLGAMKREDFLRRVSWRECDMTAITPDLRDFDFCWSSCCLEHLGSLEAGLDFIMNSVERTLKRGGVAVHTTELNLSSNEDTIKTGQTVLYRRRDIEGVIAKLRARGHEVSDMVLAPDLLSLGGHVDSPPYALPHLKLELFGYVTTSVGIVVRRGR